jgi:hypothetical protein
MTHWLAVSACFCPSFSRFPKPARNASGRTHLDAYLVRLPPSRARMPPRPLKANQRSRCSSHQPLALPGTPLEERYQHAVQQFRATQLHFQALRTQFCMVQQECSWLQQVVHTKQAVIEHLLPYYPHPLTAELIEAIELY